MAHPEILPDETALGSPPRPSRHSARGRTREVATLALPVVLQNLSITALHVVDSAMVGRIGPAELAAVGYGGVWIWTALCFFVGTAAGVQTFVSQANGAGHDSRCGPWVWRGLAVVLPSIAVATTLFALAFPWLLELLSPAPEIRELSISYVRARSMGCVGLGTLMVLAAFFRGLGDMRTPLAVSVLGNLVNVVLDYGLIFGRLGMPELGVFGAGLATAVSEWLQAILLLACFIRPALRRFGTAPVRPRLADARRFVSTGGPIGGMWFLDMITFSLFTTLIARMSSDSMAANQAFVVLLHLSFMQVIGFQVAATTLVGRYKGAGDLAAADRSFRSALGLGLGYALAVGVVFLAVPDLLMRIFSDDASVLRLGIPLLAVGAAFQLFDAAGIIASGALRGAGDTRWPFRVQMAMAWGLFLPFAYLGGIVLDGGLIGAWAGASFYLVILGATLVMRFRSGAWRSLEI